ncbi:ribonuclease inhibitor-like [Sinocyclocheilus anshuiensis]|uniref:ribonuclease inhibitor-like n=1 Tax=Sinocyclocheilus anshuiensis TaxID=1608454 RepID=UPI0007B7F44C|nr:PREDICTED: ribonuclease inhibitor-like [Sinocyclocheilus anshuiensis]
MEDTRTPRDQELSPGCSSVHQKRSKPEPSCVSMKSDASLDHLINFKSEDTRSILPPRSETKPVCEKYDQTMNQPQDSTYPGVSHEVLIMFRSNLMKKFERLYEGTAMQRNPTLLNEIYTELYITESESGEEEELNEFCLDKFVKGKNNPENMNVLQKLLPVIKESRSVHNEFIKKKIRTIDSPEKSINLFHCLNELGDRSLVEEIQQYLKSGGIKEAKLSSSQWSAVVFVLLTSEEELNEFRLDKFVEEQNNPENMKVLQKLLLVIKESRSVQLYDCGVTDEGCAALASALRSNASHLRDLDLSWNKLGDSVKMLSDVLQDPHCKLEKLGLYNCGVTDEGCAALTSALRSNPSHLRELNLSWNKLGDSVKLLSDVLQDPHCKLEKLWLSDCGVTDEGCAALASALRSNPSHLRELNLSWNKLHSVKLLSDVLQDPHCKLEKLWLSYCGVTDEGCAALASALRSNPSNLRELDLSQNKLGDSVKLLSDVLQDPDCKLEKLGLSKCGVTDEGCASLTSALRSNPSHLRELNLSENKLGDSGVKLLSDLKDDPHYKLESLYYCSVLVS